MKSALGFAALLLGACSEQDERPADWAFIAPTIIAPSCATASCHSRGAAAAGLDLSDAQTAYAGLMKQQAQYYLPQTPMQDTATCKAERGGTLCVTKRALVQACSPDESRLINLMRARGAQRMPPDRPLPLADIELIERWILSGAKQMPSDPLPSCGPIARATADGGQG